MSDAQASLSVLLIEDNAGDRRLAEVALREAGRDASIRCAVRSAESLTLGLAYLAKTDIPFDAILLDLGLPDSIRLEGLRAIRSANTSVPIIVLTGLSDLGLASEALKFGAGDYLEKSEIQPRSLLRAIRYAIERKKAEAELVRLAHTDSLTGLLNRRAFFDQLENALVQSRRSELACAVILLDIDRFKEINDVFGHKTGDEMLLAVSACLRAQLRETDSIARIGGDEFAVVATNLKSAGAAMEIAEKIVRGVDAIEELNEIRIEVSVSVGISVFPLDNSSADVLVSHADMAMYKSKASKKGSINFFDARMDAAVKARHALKRSMPDDITNGKFYLVFQPIVDAFTRKIVGAEGLARWRDPQNKVIAPGEFIPIAEESGSIGLLGNRLLEEACACVKRWGEQQKALVPISLNISPVQCRDPGFGARLISTIEQSGIPSGMINIEITESAIFRNLEIIQKNLEMIRAFGCGIQIDDFGTGYSSLSYLARFPLDTLKMDRCFVRDVDHDTAAAGVAKAVIAIGHSLGARVVAEGVDSFEQERFLREQGCDELQGFLLAGALPEDEVVRFFKPRG
jgi:diguanylate cyclase (GGDEF)-like protein